MSCAADPFVVIADGRCPFTAGGLLALADLIDRLRSAAGRRRGCKEDYAVNVKGITPGAFLQSCFDRCESNVDIRVSSWDSSELCGVPCCKAARCPAKSS